MCILGLCIVALSTHGRCSAFCNPLLSSHSFLFPSRSALSLRLLPLALPTPTPFLFSFILQNRPDSSIKFSSGSCHKSFQEITYSLSYSKSIRLMFSLSLSEIFSSARLTFP